MQLNNMNISDFLAVTASNDPVPGGGSISALCGALSAALGQMVTGLTLGRKKYAHVEEQMRELAEAFEERRAAFLDFIDLDANAYNDVMNAYKLPKETDEERAVRAEAINTALKGAAEVPLKVAQHAVGMMQDIDTLAEYGNQNAVTDSCVAMMTARTAALGAILNVKINLQSIDDPEFVERLTMECDSLRSAAVANETALLESIQL